MLELLKNVDKSMLWKLVALHVIVITVSNGLVNIPVEIFGFKLTWAAFTFPLVVIATDLTVRLLGKQIARSTIAIAYPLAIIGSILVVLAEGAPQSVALRIGFASATAYAIGTLLDVYVIQWLRDELQILSHASESEKMALAVEDSNSVIIVPAFTGLGAPYWDMNARGIITGLSRGVNRNHIVRAALEGIAFQVHDLLDSISKDLDGNISVLQVDGGAVANNFLMQFQADILQIKIDRPKNIESTALGAGMLAGLGVGFWKNPAELKAVRETDQIFIPTMSDDKRTELLSNWKLAIRKVQYT